MKLRHRKESEVSFLESPLRLPVLRTLFIIINESFLYWRPVKVILIEKSREIPVQDRMGFVISLLHDKGRE